MLKLDPLEKAYYRILISLSEFQILEASKNAGIAIKIALKDNSEIRSIFLGRIYLYASFIFIFQNKGNESNETRRKFQELKPPSNEFSNIFLTHLEGHDKIGEGKNSEAREILISTVEKYLNIGEAILATFCLSALGIIDIENATDHLKRAVEIMKEIGNEKLISQYSCTLGHLYQVKGDFNHARSLNEEALENSLKLDYEFGVGASNLCLE